MISWFWWLKLRDKGVFYLQSDCLHLDSRYRHLKNDGRKERGNLNQGDRWGGTQIIDELPWSAQSWSTHTHALKLRTKYSDKWITKIQTCLLDLLASFQMYGCHVEPEGPSILPGDGAEWSTGSTVGSQLLLSLSCWPRAGLLIIVLVIKWKQ